MYLLKKTSRENLNLRGIRVDYDYQVSYGGRWLPITVLT